MKDELIIMHRDDLEQVMNDVVKNAVREALKENAEDTTEFDEYYTVKELSQKWKISKQSIKRHVDLGHIHIVNIGKRVLFRKSEINTVGNLKYTRRRDSGINVTI